jgi:transcriptional regulator with XRE-family HTH domain
MENGCMIECENPYFRCRKQAATYNEKLSSREGAAELLGLSPSTLANYELGVTKQVPPDAVVMMADLYRAPELKGHYCAHECPIGRGMPIATKVSGIELIAVRVLKALSQGDVDEAKTKLIDIAQDGKITDDEIPTLKWLLSYLDSVARALGELRLTCQKSLAVRAEQTGIR